MLKSKFSLFGSIALVATLWTPSSAWAVYTCDQCVVGAINVLAGVTEKTARDIQQAIADATKVNVTQTGLVAAKQGQMVAEAIINSSHGAEEGRLRARYSGSSSHPCAVQGVAITVADDGGNATSSPDYVPPGASVVDVATRSALGGSGGVGSSGSRRPPRTGSPSMDAAIKVSEGTVAAPPPEVQAANAAVGACGVFASAQVNSYRATACKGILKGGAISTPKFPDADIRAETILGGPQPAADPEKFVTKFTWDMTDDKTRDAVRAYMRNISSPITLRDLRPAEYGTDEGRRYAALNDSYKSRMSLAESPIKSHIGNFAPNKDFVALVDTISRGDDYANRYFPKSFPEWRSKGISVSELINFEVQRRYYNPNWYRRLETAETDKDILLEQTYLMAFQNALTWRMIQDINRMNVAQAAQMTANIRLEMMPQLAAQHELATK